MPKMKEIQKVVQKLSCEQNLRQRANRYKNIKSHPVYRGDLMVLHQEILGANKVPHWHMGYLNEILDKWFSYQF